MMSHRRVDQRSDGGSPLSCRRSGRHPDLPIQLASARRTMMRDQLKAELEQAVGALKAHMATWEYAFAMAGGCHGGSEHPVHWITRARTERLAARCRDLRARLAEQEL
jgi:hypothetical protein